MLRATVTGSVWATRRVQAIPRGAFLEVVTDDDLSFPSSADFVQILLVGKAGLCSGAVIQNQKAGLSLPRNRGQL